MTISTHKRNGDTRIARCSRIAHEDELLEAIWLIQKEIRGGLPKSERIEAERQIAAYRERLDALRGGLPSLLPGDILF